MQKVNHHDSGWIHPRAVSSVKDVSPTQKASDDGPFATMRWLGSHGSKSSAKPFSGVA